MEESKHSVLQNDAPGQLPSYDPGELHSQEYKSVRKNRFPEIPPSAQKPRESIFSGGDLPTGNERSLSPHDIHAESQVWMQDYSLSRLLKGAEENQVTSMEKLERAKVCLERQDARATLQLPIVSDGQRLEIVMFRCLDLNTRFPFRGSLRSRSCIQLGMLYNNAVLPGFSDRGTFSLFFKEQQLSRIEEYLLNVDRRTKRRYAMQKRFAWRANRLSKSHFSVRYAFEETSANFSDKEQEMAAFFHVYVYHLLYSGDMHFFLKLLRMEICFDALFGDALARLTSVPQLREIL